MVYKKRSIRNTGEMFLLAHVISNPKCAPESFDTKMGFIAKSRLFFYVNFFNFRLVFNPYKKNVWPNLSK